MLKYTVKRVLQALIVLWGVYTLTFLVVHMVPGDPVQIMMSKRADPAMMERIREQLGLNRPILAQYVPIWAGRCRESWDSPISRAFP